MTKVILKKAKLNGTTIFGDFRIKYTNGWYMIHDNNGWAYYVGAFKGASKFLEGK